MITITVLINYRNKENKKGFYSIYMRITLQRKQRYYKIKIPQKVTLQDWSGETDNWVRNTHPYAFEINNKISDMKNQVMDVVKRCYNHNKPINFFAIDRELTRKGDRKVLNDYIRNFIYKPPENIILSDVTWEKYKAFQKHLDAFQPKIMFSDLDDVLVSRFRNYLGKLKGRNGKMNPATIKSYFDKFKVDAFVK